MQYVRSSLVVDAPAERVFEHVDDWENTARYLRFVALDPIDGERTQGTGARFRMRVTLARPAPLVWVGEAVVVDHYYPERLVLSLDGNFTLEWTFGRVGERTLVELSVGYRLPGGPVGRVAGTTMSPLAQRNVSGALAELKRQVETGGP